MGRAVAGDLLQRGWGRAAGRTAVRVASVPTDHVYVRHLSPPGPAATGGPDRDPGPAVVRLPDPTRPWWPPRVLDPVWLRDNVDAFDVVHVHFGFDALSPADLARFTRTLRDLGRPLVLTVHDLRNPHHPTRGLHDAQLDVLVPAADALLTLTRGAAAEVAARWGRRPLVVPHPHVVDLDTLADRPRHRDPRSPGEPAVVGVHLKSLRACMWGAPVVDALREIISRTEGAVLRVDAHTDVAAPDGARYDAPLARALDRAAAAGADVHVHDYFSDAELWDYLSGLDVSVLPYRFGTHSGWLEACRDLGTAVAAPSCGYYAEQGPVHTFGSDEDGLDVTSLEVAVHDALEAARGVQPVPSTARVEQRQELARVHARVYAEVTR